MAGQSALSFGAAGDAARADTVLRQALGIFQRIGAAEVGEVSAELEALTDTWSTAH